MFTHPPRPAPGRSFATGTAVAEVVDEIGDFFEGEEEEEEEEG